MSRVRLFGPFCVVVVVALIVQPVAAGGDGSQKSDVRDQKSDQPTTHPSQLTPSPPADQALFFESKIRPLLVARCFECHSEKGKGIKGGLRLDSGKAILVGGDSGPAVIAGKPDESLLIEAINYSQGSVQMPPRGKLPQAEIDLLIEWVRRGAHYPDNAAASGSAKQKPGIDFEAGRKFWSFQSVRVQPLPATRNDHTSTRGRIDLFIDQKLAAAGIVANGPADRRTLLRRLSYDLTGLPPSADEIDAFVADERPDAYDRQVERLLASPQYGEKWGRFWLDLVRYCDVPEAWSVDKVARAWLYRDWVVQALNDDLPYDRFLELQLAADLVPDARPADTAALGFLGLSPTYWKELKLDPGVIKSVVAEEWEERIHTLSGVVLGLTVACARCHDHKQDPISQEDYYALAGVFASTKLTPRPVLPEAAARVVAAAHERVLSLEKQREELRLREPKLPEGTILEAALTLEIAEIERTTPHYREPFAYAAEEASLFVLPDGPDRTRLEYRTGEAQNVALQVRGNPTNPGPVVARRFLSVLSPTSPPAFRQGSGRRELARSFFSEAAPLTARVIVNRVWQQHFGQGLVDTPSNFGSTGSRPTHPELLDDLAARFISSGWSLKWLHREIVGSATWQRASHQPQRVSGPTPNVLPPNNTPTQRASGLTPDVWITGDPVAKRRRGVASGDSHWTPSAENPAPAGRREQSNNTSPSPARLTTHHLPPFYTGSLTSPLPGLRVIATRSSGYRHWLHHVAPIGAAPFAGRDSNPAFLMRQSSRDTAAALQASHAPPATGLDNIAADPIRHNESLDPDNRLLWRANRRRLEVEAWRDTMLLATGRLDLSIGGPDLDLDTPANHRRTLYATVKRRDLNTMLRLNDFPDPATHTATRDVTTTPLQQLFVLNSPFLRDQATALVDRVRRDTVGSTPASPAHPDAQIQTAYRLLFGRPPTEKQTQLTRAFLAAAGGDPAKLGELWKQFAQALLGSNEAVFVD